MRLGMFMMPVHPPDRAFWSTLEEDTEKSILADRWASTSSGWASTSPPPPSPSPRR